MSGLVPWQTDPIRPERPAPVHITVDGMSVEGLQGQSLAGILLAQDRTAWRTTVAGRGRGVFCGIGVCFDCIATVNGESDVRLCMRRARDGDTVEIQDDTVGSDAGQAGSRRTVAANRTAAAADAIHPATGAAGAAARNGAALAGRDITGSEGSQGNSTEPGASRTGAHRAGAAHPATVTGAADAAGRIDAAVAGRVTAENEGPQGDSGVPGTARDFSGSPGASAKEEQP